MGFSRAVTAINYCQILAASKQTPYGVLSACLVNIRKKQDVDETYGVLVEAAKSKNATDEELNAELQAFDEKFLAECRKIKYELIETVKSEMIPIQRKDGDKIVAAEMDIREVLAMLDECGLITY